MVQGCRARVPRRRVGVKNKLQGRKAPLEFSFCSSVGVEVDIVSEGEEHLG